MGKNTAINWCHHTANFWWGCQKVSEGCKNCYAETLSRRYGKSIWGPPATTVREKKKAVWGDIWKWDAEAKAAGERRRVFVSSMSDFLEDHPMVEAWRQSAIAALWGLEWLDVLLLTKRPENAERFLSMWYDKWPAHVWFGVSIEDQETANRRLSWLWKVPAAIHFISAEPLLESVNLFMMKTDEIKRWVIVGGESGIGCRPFEWDWARALRDQCQRAGVPFWMKQGGGHPNKRHKLEDIPEDLRIRELPQ